MNNTYLCHHGIKGQKWGIRRFQNEDGSLTDEGKKKYGTVEKFEGSKNYQKIKSKDFKQIDKSLANSIRSKQSNIDPKMTEYANEVYSTKEYNDFNRYSKLGRVEFSDKATAEAFMRGYKETADKYKEKIDEIWAKHEEDLTSAAIKDLGVEDTYLGRKYIKQYLNEVLK